MSMEVVFHNLSEVQVVQDLRYKEELNLIIMNFLISMVNFQVEKILEEKYLHYLFQQVIQHIFHHSQVIELRVMTQSQDLGQKFKLSMHLTHPIKAVI